MTFTPRDYQQTHIEAGTAFFNGGHTNQLGESKNGVLVVPTGGGKSIVIGKIATEMPGMTLVLQPSKEILEQNYKKTVAFGYENLGIYSASFGIKRLGKITFATIGSIISRPELFANFDRIIMDEAHYANPKQGMYKDFFAHIGKPVLGLTATPYRLHPANTVTGATVKFITRTRPRTFDSILHITQKRELFERGYLCPLQYVTPNTIDGVLKLNSTGADFTDRSIQEFSDEINLKARIVQAIHDVPFKHGLVFVPFVADAYALLSTLEGLRIPAAVITGEMLAKQRALVLEQFTQGVFRVLLNVGVLTTGYDFPALDAVFHGRPTNSISLFEQITGRAVRICPGKEIATCIDLVGNTQRFGKFEDMEIVEVKPGMHRLKSGDRFLTGVDLASGIDLEQRAAKPQPMATSQGPRDSIVRWGKFGGQCIKTVPAHYLKWVSENFGEGNALQMAVDELNRRRSMGVRV